MTGVKKISPDWPAPDHVVAFSTCRSGGVSLKPYNSLNLALHVGDESIAVNSNRHLLAQSCPQLSAIQWLEQTHSTEVANLTRHSEQALQADACYTQQSGLACAVMTADCLPVLFCDEQGVEVAAVHAGWRGLVNSVIEKTLRQFTSPNKKIFAWMGPAISQKNFEVGPEVRDQFLGQAIAEDRVLTEQAFKPNPYRSNHYFADLYRLAELRLRRVGVTHIYGGDHCSFNESESFFSYRREGNTGRMVSLIYKKSF